MVKAIPCYYFPHYTTTTTVNCKQEPLKKTKTKKAKTPHVHNRNKRLGMSKNCHNIFGVSNILNSWRRYKIWTCRDWPFASLNTHVMSWSLLNVFRLDCDLLIQAADGFKVNVGKAAVMPTEARSLIPFNLLRVTHRETMSIPLIFHCLNNIINN